MAWAKRQKTGSASAKLVLLVLADYADEHGRCWPSQATIAAEAELTDRSVRNQLLTLEGAGLIRREERRRDDNSRSTDTIILAIEPFEQAPRPPGKSFQAPRKDVPGGAEPDSGGYRKEVPGAPERDSGLTTFEPPSDPPEEPPYEPSARDAALGSGFALTPTSSEGPKRRSQAKATAEETAAFDEFWAIYPLRKGKRPALDAFVAALRGGADREAILEGARAYAGERAGKDPARTKYAQGWLNDRRWEDEVIADGPYVAPGSWSALDYAARHIAEEREEFQ